MTDERIDEQIVRAYMSLNTGNVGRPAYHDALAALARMVARIAALEKRIENVACFGDETCMCNDCYFINRHRP